MTRSKFLLGTALALVLCFTHCATAAPPATCVISGTVLDGGGSPVASTIVRFRTIAPTLISGAGMATQDLTTKTSATGTWSLTLVQGLNAQVDIPAVGIKSDTVIPTGASCPAAFTDLTLYLRGTLTPQTILADHGPSMGGDLTGSSPNPSVVGFRGVGLHADTPADGRVWIYRSASSDYRLEALPVTTAVTAVQAGQGITVTGTTLPTVAITNGGIVGSMLATGTAASNVGSLGGDLSGSLPSPQIGAGAIVNADVNAAAAIEWTKLSKVGAVASDVGAVSSTGVLAAINASAETPKISASQLAGGIAESQVTNLVSDLAAKRNTADAIPQADVTGLVAALAGKESTANKGAVSGYASLDGTGKVPSAQLPTTLVADGDKGDITVSGSGATWTVDPLTVTFAKMQAIATDSLIGRATAGTGAPELITATAAGRDLLDDTTAANQRTTLGLGTSAVLNVPATGDAAAGEVVKGSDTRLADSRAPTAHTHAEADVTNLVSDLAAKVPATRSVLTTAPLTGGGTLAGDLTLAVSDASVAAKGILQLAGDLGGTAASPSVASVGGQSAANVASGVALALAATDASTPSTIVKRSSGGAATLDVVGNVTGNVTGTAANVTGVVAIANGGTGQATATPAFDALSPTSTKGDLIGHDGSASVRLAVGTDGQILTADSTATSGLKWAAASGTGSVTSVATGNGLQGGPITSTGTIDLRLNASGGLSKILGGGGNELGIATGGVTDAMLENAKVDTVTSIATTAPLRIDGGASADLSTSRTLSVTGATTGAVGVVQLAGDLAGTSTAPSVATVGGQTAANVAAGSVLANAATNTNTASAIVRRDASGNFSAGTVTANLTGNVTGNVMGNVTGDLTGGTATALIRDKGGEVFNVKAYGATGDGTTDDTTAIGSAITALGSTGGVLYFPPGNYKFSTLTISVNGTILRGAGRGATTLSTTTVGGTAITLSGDDTALEDMTVDVIGTAVTPQISLAMSGARAKLTRASFTDWFRGVYVTGVGCVLEGNILTSAASGAEYGVKTFGSVLNTTIDGLVITATATSGVHLEENGPTQILRNAAVTMSGNSNGLYTTSTGSTIMDSSFYGAGTGSAVQVDDGISTFRNVVAAVGVHAFYVSNQSTVYAYSCSFRHPDGTGTSTGDAVLLDVDGSVHFYDVTVGGGAVTFASVNVPNASAWFDWHGGTIYSQSTGGGGHAAYGLVWEGDRISLYDVEASTSAAFTSAVFALGALRGTAVASAASIALPSRVTHVTGTTAINTITAASKSEPLTLIPDGAWSLTTAGNIAVALTATVGFPITIVYDDVTAKWYPSVAIAPISTTGTAVTIAGPTTITDPLYAERSVEAVTTTKSPASTESREAYTNEGDADGASVTLPAAAAGLEYTAIVQAAQLLTINAAAGDTIRLGPNVTAAAGYVRSNVVGSRLILLAINATEWIATSFSGEWTNGTWWTYDTHAEGAIYWATPAATSNGVATPIKCAGTTAAQGTALSVTQATTNRLTYTGVATRNFKVTATVGLSAAAATNGKLHLYKNGSLITGSTITRVLPISDIGAMAIHALVSLAPTDYVELWCETDDGDDITIQNGVLSISSID